MQKNTLKQKKSSKMKWIRGSNKRWNMKKIFYSKSKLSTKIKMVQWEKSTISRSSISTPQIILSNFITFSYITFTDYSLFMNTISLTYPHGNGIIPTIMLRSLEISACTSNILSAVISNYQELILELPFNLLNS